MKAGIRFVNEPFKDSFHNIDEILYDRRDFNHIVPRDKKDFDPKHLYSVYCCYCLGDDCTRTNSKCRHYKGYIFGLGETEAEILYDYKNTGSRIIFKNRRIVDSTSSDSDATQKSKVMKKTLRKGLGNITNTVKVKNVQITLEKFAVNKFLKQREKIECTKNVPKTTNENIVKCRRQLKYRIPVQVNETAVGSSSSRNEKSESVHQGMKNKNEDDRIENCFNELNNMKNRSEKHNIATNHNEENDIMIKKDGDNNIASEDENNMTSEDEYNMTSEDKENNAPNAHEENDIASEDERHTDENDLINENVRNRRGTTENDNILISNEELARPLQMSDDSSDEVTEEGIDNFLVRHKNDGHLKLYQRKLLYYLKKDARAEIAYENEPALYSEEGSQVYLGMGIRVGALSWKMIEHKKNDIFIRDTALLIWKKKDLCNRCIRRLRVANRIPNRSPVKNITPQKLNHLFKLYRNHLVTYKKYPEDRIKWSMKKITLVLGFLIRDLRQKEMKKARRALRNTR